MTSTARPPRRAPAQGSNGRLSNGPPRTLPAAAPGARPGQGGRGTAIRPRAPRPSAPRERCQGPAAPRPCGRAGGAPRRHRLRHRRAAAAIKVRGAAQGRGLSPQAHRRHPRGCSHDAPKHRGATRPENTRARLETGTGARRAARPAPAGIRPRLREAAACRSAEAAPARSCLGLSLCLYPIPYFCALAAMPRPCVAGNSPLSSPPPAGPLGAVRSLPRRAEVPRGAPGSCVSAARPDPARATGRDAGGEPSPLAVREVRGWAQPGAAGGRSPAESRRRPGCGV